MNQRIETRRGSRRLNKGVLVPLVAAACAAVMPAQAQKYPDRPVKVLVGFAAGGSTDLVARAVTRHMEGSLGQPFVVENKLGASGTVATAALAQSPADGYTLGACSTSAFTILPYLMKSVRYDPVKDFQPIVQIGLAPYVLVASQQLRAATLHEVIELARTRKGGLTYASGGVGSASHLAGELFAAAVGVKMVHVPYKGLAEAMADVIGGQVDLAFDQEASAGANIKANRLKPVAIASASRSRTLPDVPTFTEAGVSLEAAQWIGLCGPAGMAPERVAELHRSAVAAIQNPDVTARFQQLGVVAAPLGPGDFTRAIDVDRARWQRLIAKTKITLD